MGTTQTHRGSSGTSSLIQQKLVLVSHFSPLLSHSLLLSPSVSFLPSPFILQYNFLSRSLMFDQLSMCVHERVHVHALSSPLVCSHSAAQSRALFVFSFALARREGHTQVRVTLVFVAVLAVWSLVVEEVTVRLLCCLSTPSWSSVAVDNAHSIEF